MYYVYVYLCIICVCINNECRSYNIYNTSQLSLIKHTYHRICEHLLRHELMDHAIVRPAVEPLGNSSVTQPAARGEVGSQLGWIWVSYHISLL